MKGKTVIVTGSSDNIGAAIAKRFAREGASLVINARKSIAEGERVAKQIVESSGKAVFVQADVSVKSQAKVLINSAMENFGRIDILINNAGRFEHAFFAEATSEHWDGMLRDNLISAVNCCAAASKVMTNPGGRILNMASIRAFPGGGRPGAIAYSAAKAAVVSFTNSLAAELAPGILVNAVAPGNTKTSAFDRVPKAVVDAFLGSTLLKRWLTPEEIADAFYFLATADGITGEVLTVDAGWKAWPSGL